MEYYYDVTLNFNDYPINYYEWTSDDKIERILKIPVIKIADIKPIINHEVLIDTDLDQLVLTDGINCIAVELVKGKVIYSSFLPYEDEDNICNLAHNMEESPLKITILKKKELPSELRINELIKKFLLKKIEESSPELLKYIYYDITLKSTNDLAKIKKFLIKDISNNFSDKYINLFENIYK